MRILEKLMDEEFDFKMLEVDLQRVRDAVHADDADQMRLAMGRDADCLDSLWGRTATIVKVESPVKVSDDFGGMA